MRFNDGNSIKQSFEIKADGSVRCRVKLENPEVPETRRRISMQGELAYSYYGFEKYIPAKDLYVILQNDDGTDYKLLEGTVVE
jgi:hypothetical protein